MKKILLLILLVGIHLTSFGQVQFWSDDFENATAPSSGTRSPSYNGGVGGTPFIAYFLRTQGNNIDLDPSLSDGPYSNVQGSWFWAGEDHDAFGNAEQTIVWSGIDISGKNNITFQGLFAAQSTYAAWESILFGFSHDDYVTVEYSIDGAAYQKLIDFRANSGAQPPGPDIILNQYKQLADDTNFDGIGNGTVLTKAFNEFTKTIPGSGSTLSLRLRASSNNSYTEEWAIDNFRLLATAANSAPVATAPSAPSVTEDAINVALANNIQVNDADGDNQTVTFTVTGGTVSLGTTGITFGGGGNGSANFTASGTLANINAALDAATFTPTPNLFGTNAGTISFFSNDGTVNSNTATVSFDIAGVNDPPNITGLPSTITVTEDATEDPLDISSATISDIDAGSGELTLKLEATGGIFDYAAGPGITLTGQLTNEATFTGNLTDLNNYINIPSNIYFRPDANLSGNGAASVNVSINDNGNTGSGGGTDIPVGTISVNITPVNDAPTDILLDNNSVAENETIGTVVGLFSALDVDNGDTFTFTLVSGTGDTDNSVFSISGNELRTAAVFDFETKNSYSIRVRVTDSGGLTFEKPFTATVDEVNESPSEILLDNSSVAENEATGTTVGTFSAVDPNAGDTFVYTFADGAGDEDNDSFTLTGDELLTGEVFDFETKNSYSIRVRVTDSGGLFLELPFSISITDVNEAPTVVNPIPNQNIDQGEELSFQFAINTFHDVDGDDLTYSAQLSGGGALPAWLSFNPANRTFSGTPLNSHVGTVSIDVTADDENGGAITDTFNITVANVNDAPTVTNTIPNQNATEDLAFSFQFASNTFSDIDVGDVLTYSAEQTGGDPLPAWLDFDPLTRTFSGTPSNLDVGNITIEVTAADMSNASVSTSFTLTVLNVNDAPTVANPIDNQNATQDVLFEFVVPANTFEDIDGDDLTYSAQLAGGGALPAWLSFNPANRTFNGTPLNAHVGTLSIDVIANDGNGESAIDTFDLVVANVNDAPTVANPIPNQDATEGVVFSFQFASNTFSDIDVGDVLTYSAEQTGGDPLPAWLDFDPLTRTFSGTPGNDDTGLITIEVIANDGNGGTVYDSFELSIQGVNDAPVITAPLTISVFEDEPEALTGISFTDVDAGSSDVQATFEVGSGTLSAISGNGVTVGGTSTSLILEGSLSDINAFISNGELTFTTALNATSDVNLNISITDNGNTGSGGSLTDQTNVTLTVTAVNDAPVNTVPGTQQTDQDAALVFSSGNGNLFSVSDVDAGSNDIQITLTAANGLISLSGTGGLTFTQGSGVNDGTMVFVGTIVDINTALDGLIFSPIAGFNGLASLSITSNDQGFSGSGGVQTDTDVVSITVNSVNPIVTLVTSSAVNGIYKVGDELSILVDFDQAVTVNTAVGEPTLTLETGGTDREVSYISGSGSSSLVFNYTVQPGDVSSDLDYTSTNALVLNGATIENSSGDAAIISLPPVGSPNSISGQKDIQIDGVIPVIASVSVPADQTYVAGETLEFTVNFSEAVVVTGNPQISISIGAQTQQAVFVSGSGSSALVFSYTVQSGDLDDNGIVIGSLSLNGGTIRDAAGNNANLTLNSVGVTDQVLVDAVAPSGYAVSFELGSQSIINTSNVETVAFEGSPLEIGTTLSYEFSSSTSGAPITGTASVSSETQVFDNAGSGYDLTSLGDGTITLTVSLTDAAGNVGVDATTTVTKDATAPTGYAVAWDDLLINAIESSNTSFTLSNAEVNTVADYSISSSGDGNTATITGSLSVTSAVQQIPVDVSTLTDGVLTVEVTLTDEGDNEGGIVSANNATLDQTAPASPSTPDLTDASDTGVSNTDNITADNTPTFAGTAEANATVEVFGDGSSLGTTTADGSGYWDFTSALMVDGTYAITATATDAAGNVSLPSAALSITIDQNECNAQADFIFSPTEGCTAPMTVFFTDQSISADVWAWDFGDGSSSTAQNPIHSYTTYGDFTVKLTVTDTEYGCSSTIEKVFSNYELSADFNANVAFGCGPLEVGFEDLSVGAESWNWDFGDGNTSTDQNPTHIYEQPGNYAVVLTTTGGACSKTITKNNYIQVIGSDVDFSTDITEGCGPLTVAFTNLSTYSSPPISFLWDFGDGSTSTLQNPTHDYASAGTYTVKLTVNDLDGCSRTLTKTGLIQVNLLDVSISKTDVTCDGGFDGSITVTPNEGLAPFTYEWSNGASTAEISGISAGNYSVIITDANGCSVTKSVEITEPIPAVLSTSNPSSISHSSAELGGELLGGLDCAQETGIVYATISNPDISDTKVIMTLTGNIFSEVVSGLQVNTSYYARAYSTNQNGITTYSNEVVFTTSKKILEITAVAGQSKFYGEADPVFTYTATGFEGGDDESVLTGALERVAGENVGSYAIQQGTLDAGDNYTIDFTSADFEVIPTDITGITFDDGSFTFDGTEKTIETTGTLPAGTSVAYSDNTRTNVGTQEATATITGANFTTLVLTADLTITPADVSEITFEDASFVYDGTAKSLAITGTLPAGTSVAYTNNSRTDVGTQEVTATITGSNYATLVLTADLTITPADVSGITFEDGSFVFDGTAKSLAVSGTLPDGTSVAYTNNSRTDVGTQEVTATITGSNYNTLVLTADLTITPADVSEITFEDGGFVYDGSVKSLAITGTLPAGTSVAYTNNSRTEVGTQEVTATISGSNYNTLVLTADLTVTPADVSEITFEDGGFVYDGSVKSLAITGTLPAGTSVAYTNNSRTDVGTQEVTATISGSNFTTLVLTADLTVTPADVSGITFEDGSFVFDGTAKSLAITGTLPDGTSVAYTDNSRTVVGTQEVTATISGSNFTTLVLTADLTITPADVSGITFEDGSFVYDGTAKSLAITGTLPAGTSVTYTNNSRTDVGTQEVTATITGSNYTTLVLTADLTVTSAGVSGITFEDASFVYDGTAKSLAITGTLPDGTSVAYTNNSRTDVGTQEVTATITGSNYNTLVLTADLTITPADVSEITFEDASFVYDGTAKSLAITGTLPAGTSVAYTNNSRTDVGTQEVTATISGSNFTTLVLTADLTITPADVSGITFDDGSFVFDGTAKSLAVSGTLPDGTSVAYTNNSRTVVGTQEVTATISGSNFTTLVLTADLTITPADVSGITFEDGSFVFDGTDKSLAVSGTLPDGTSVAYTNNSRTDVGSQEVTATISGSNFTTLVLTADLTITPADISGITFEDGSFIFDGTDKSLAITGTLPAGTSVTYTNNSRTDVGTQEVTATITGSNYTTLVLTADLTVTPADVSGITFDDGSFVFDGTAKSLAITGTLPAGTSVAYTNNSRTDVGTQEVMATITGSNYNTLVLTADLTVTPADVSGITFNDGSFVFDGTAKSLAITGTLPDGTSVAYTDNSRTDVGTQEVTATISGSNYNTLVLTADLTVTPADVSGITFEDGSFVFDGTAKSLAITGTLPAGTSVAYTNNSRTEVGTQEVTATITGSNYNTLVLTADLTVTPNDVSGITFEDASFVYDGSVKSLAINGTLPAGTSVAYTNNSRTDVGTQEVMATITGSNYNTLVLTADLTITPADVSGITFDDGSFVFDGTAKSLAITGTLPAETSVAYTDNSRTDVGTQEVTATISGSNYNALVLTADLTVTPADVSGITFEDGSFVFDGTAKSLAITGTLPAGTSVAYTNNSRTDVGTQEVMATITGSNYNTLVLTADLTVTPADVSGITFNDGSFVFDGTAKSLAITGTLPDGTSVAYTDNSRTDVGTQEVTATITGSNFITLVLTADLTVTPADVSGITLEDGSFVFDGTAKSLAITGTLPDGTSVAYTDNSRTDVGTQEVTATISGSNYNTLVLTADLTVTPADVSGITFDDGSFVFDGTAKSLAISGTLPAGTSVAYTNNSRTDVGTQEVTATITGSNYNALVLTADLTVTPADVSGITFEDGSFVFDGTAKSLAISGTLPAGTSVAYTSNSKTDVGTQEVTATISGSNFTTLVLTADLTVTPAMLYITVDRGQSKEVGTADPELTYTASGFVAGEDESVITGSLNRNAGEDVGSYSINLGSLDAGSNYTIEFAGANFIITEPANLDSDGDGVPDNVEEEQDTDPDDPTDYLDTDGDGVPDYVEEIEGTDPDDAGDYLDSDGDKVPDYVEGRQGTDPDDPNDFRDTDGDGVPDYVNERSVIEFVSQSIETPWGTAAAELKVPNEVVLITAKGEFINLAVQWDLEGYNPLNIGTSIYYGTVEIPAGLFNPEDLQPLLEVIVLAKPAPEDVTLSQNSFVAVPEQFFQEIGAFTVLDPLDDQHMFSLPEGVNDNQYFEVLDGILFWSSAEQVEGRTGFEITLVVTDRAGNVLTKDFQITRERTPLDQLEIANTFTPNGDGVNDTWGMPALRYYSGVRISVFAVGGERLFYTEDPDVRWDGMFNGKEMPVGAYLYVIEVGETGEVKRGMLNLLNQ